MDCGREEDAGPRPVPENHQPDVVRGHAQHQAVLMGRNQTEFWAQAEATAKGTYVPSFDSEVSPGEPAEQMTARRIGCGPTCVPSLECARGAGGESDQYHGLWRQGDVSDEFSFRVER